MIPDLAALCADARRPDERRETAIAELCDLWFSGSLTAPEAGEAVAALADAATVLHDRDAMCVLGYGHLENGNYGPALHWLSRAVLYGAAGTIRYAAAAALHLADEQEPDYPGPLTLDAIGWLLLAARFEADRHCAARMVQAALQVAADIGLTRAELRAIETQAEEHLQVVH